MRSISQRLSLSGAKLVPDVVMESTNGHNSSSALDILELLKVKTAKDLQLDFQIDK
ncbi:hypothetical protein [Orenia metallireducens]|uniref:hypothetical protein n=1 Tax=Orenia metallireducens TaxID=1413210 RepID=UPI00155345BD|nr:hypothetical protein [Orenia metallireducens]